MAEKSDDIKQLFSHLGLNPNDYHEIRSAPTANATVSEAPRRWSLLQAAPAAGAAALPAKSVPVAPAPATSVMAAMQALAADLAPKASALPAALLAAAPEPQRSEVPMLRPVPIIAEAPPTLEPTPSAGALPAGLSAVFERGIAPPQDGLQSLFQSVKEPQTAAVFAVGYGDDAGRPTERRTDQLLQPPLAASSLASRAADYDHAQPPMLPTPQSLLPVSDDEPETRYAAPPSRLGPIPQAAAPVATPALPAMPPAGDGRLKLRLGQASAAAAAEPQRESMQDVFRRLSGSRTH